MSTGIRSFFSNLRKKRIIEILAAFIAGGWLIIEFVDRILVAHYHFSDKTIDITFITLLCALFCTLIWRWFSGREAPRKFKLELVLIPLVVLITVLLDINLLLHLKGPESEAIPTSKWNNSIAILPFVDMSPQKDQDWFCDGITDEIISRLSNISELKVPARTSVFFFKGKEQDIREIGARLAVDSILEGSVRRAGNRIRVTAQLINVSDGCHIWSERYEREILDVFAIQDEISQAIADKLRVGIGRKHSAVRRPTEDLEAYNLYLQGRYHLFKWTPEGFGRARPCFEQAVARDPAFALAFDALAEFYWYIGFFGIVPPKEAFSTGIWAALRAVEIDDTLAETHALIGMYRKELDYNWPEVEREMWRALELNPSSPTVRLRNAISGLMPLGRLEESVAELKIVIESDPLSLFHRWWLAIMHLLARDYVRAMEQARFMVELDPAYYLGHWMCGMSSMVQGRHADATAELRQAVKLSDGLPLMMGWFGLALGRSGESGEARVLLQQLSEISRAAYVPPSCFAWIHLGLGEVEDAFAWMDRAIDARDPMMMPIKSYPFFDPLRSDPRYHALLRRMNLEA